MGLRLFGLECVVGVVVYEGGACAMSAEEAVLPGAERAVVRVVWG